MDDRRGWFADVDPDLPESDEHRWQPCLQAEEGVCHSFEVWFRTETECVAYIREHIIDQRMIWPVHRRAVSSRGDGGDRT